MKTIQAKASLSLLLLATICLTANAQDWPRFRGPNGSGVSTGDATPPVTWSDTENLKWKIELPGPGHSCPIVVGDKVFLTCWTGYGVDEGATQEDLRLHLLCFNRADGEQVWGKALEPTLPEETYAQGNMFAEHGFATHTPVSDGKHVWAFFGKSGAVCFDMDGNEKWRKNLGKDLDPKRWGSSSSPILYKDVLIVTASVESNTLYGLNKLTGEEVWSVPADGFASTWGTPVLAKVDDDRTDLVIAVPYEIWGFNPETGKFLWFCESLETNSACASAVAEQEKVYFVESGRGGGGSIAVGAGGKDDVTKSHVKWKVGERNRIGTPVVFDSKLYWVGNNMAQCISAEDGSSVYEARLERPKNAPAASSGGGGGGRRGGGMRGEYSSPVAAGANLYYVTRKGEVYVIEMGDEFKQLAVNVFSDGGEFSASPAISNGELFVRSTKMLYCISDQ
jgi:outer membrane protein assembly factor BamB